MLVINNFLVFGSFAFVLFQILSSVAIVTPDDDKLNTAVRKYLRQYKDDIVAAETNFTRHLFRNLEPIFHEFVQEVSVLYDLDNQAVNKCIHNEVKNFDVKKLQTQSCLLILDLDKQNFRYANLVNCGNFTRAVKAHCRNIDNSNTSQIEKCVNEIGPDFIKKQKATVDDAKRDGDQLVKRADICAKNIKERYKKLKKLMQDKCGNVH